MAVRPLDALVVDVGTAVANFVLLVEVCELVASVLLDFLARGDFCFDLTCCHGVIASIEFVELFVDAFRHSDGLHGTIYAVFSAVRVNFRQMNRVDRLDSMEVIVVFNLHSLTGQGAAHYGLGIQMTPG